MLLASTMVACDQAGDVPGHKIAFPASANSKNGERAGVREKALMTRYVTVMSHIKHLELEEDQLSEYRQEPMILGSIAYYYREPDPEFAELLRRLAASLLRQFGTTFEAEFSVFKNNFIAPQREEDAITILELWGFDPETARMIVSDARADSLSEFKAWMQAESTKK